MRAVVCGKRGLTMGQTLLLKVSRALTMVYSLGQLRGQLSRGSQKGSPKCRYFEADMNLMIGILFGWRAMHHITSNKLHHKG